MSATSTCLTPEARLKFETRFMLEARSSTPESQCATGFFVQVSAAQISVTQWRGDVVVIRLPHDPEVPSSNPGKNNTSYFSY